MMKHPACHKKRKCSARLKKKVDKKLNRAQSRASFAAVYLQAYPVMGEILMRLSFSTAEWKRELVFSVREKKNVVHEFAKIEKLFGIHEFTNRTRILIST